ncbi:hypothetical protein ANTPLA_LOCUS10929 [Anthophora plagiata]
MGAIGGIRSYALFAAFLLFVESGGIGTKRFCSALDLGNYCDYVKQQGDKLNYRTCIHTCTGDGCNPAAIFKPTIAWTVPFGLLLFYELFFER